MKKNIVLVILVLFLLGIGVVIFFSSGGEDGLKDLLPIDSNSQKWHGQQQLPQAGKSKGISVQGFSSLVFIADEKNQKVNFLNSEKNDCLCRMTLYADEKELWKSEYIQPGYGIYDLELTDSLSEGSYSGTLLYEYFKEDETPLNSAKIKFNLQVVSKE